MTDRKPTSVNLDADNRSRLENDNVNRSDLINDLVREYYEGQGEVNRAVRQFRVSQLKQELRSLNDERERKEAELERIQQAMDEEIESYEDRLDATLEQMEEFNNPMSAENPRIRSIATDTEREPATVMADLQARADEQDRDIAPYQWEDDEQ